MTHNLAQISYTTHYQAHLKTNVCLSKKVVKCNEIARGHLSKITKTASVPGMEFSMDKSQYGGYITRH